MRKQTPGWYYMKITQPILTTEYWSQTLIPTYLYYVSLQNYIDERVYFLAGVKIPEGLLISKLLEKTLWRQWMFAMLQMNCFWHLCWFPQLYGMRHCTFTVRNETKPLKLRTKSLLYIEAFFTFGKEITLPDSLVNTLGMFVCYMYGWKENGVHNAMMHYPPVMML